MKTTTKLWIGITILVILSPVGLLLPEYFKAGAAWGEWGSEEIKSIIGYVPSGLEKFSKIWKAPVPDYAFKALEEKGMPHLSFAYIISAVTGILLVVIIVFLFAKFFIKDEK